MASRSVGGRPFVVSTEVPAERRHGAGRRDEPRRLSPVAEAGQRYPVREFEERLRRTQIVAVRGQGRACGAVVHGAHPLFSARFERAVMECFLQMATSYELRQPGTPDNLPVLTLSSNTFADGGVIPLLAASAWAGGSDVSPDLMWGGAPANTQSYVVTCFDPDAPTGVGFWHWTLVNVPASVTSLAAGAAKNPPAGSVQGYTDYGSSGYGGPCPPEGDPPHHYRFTVYALDVPQVEGVGPGTTGAFLMFSLRGHVLAQGTYTGLYSR